jgi:hypothetical protein
MASLNILRDDPTFPDEIQSGAYTCHLVEPAMCYLFPCYQILSRCLDHLPDAPFITFSLVHRLFFLTQLPDNQERSLIAEFLKEYYTVRLAEQPKFIRALRDQFVLLRENSLIPLAAPPLLAIALHCISMGLRVHSREVLSLINVGVFPLVSHEYLPTFFPVFRQVLFRRIFEDMPELALGFAVRLQNTWPVASAAKSVCFAELLLSTACCLTQSQFGSIAWLFFGFMLGMLNSPVFIVRLAAMSIYEKPEWIPLLRHHHTVFLDKLFLPIVALSTRDWHHEVRVKSARICAIMEKESPGDCARLKLDAQHARLESDAMHEHREDDNLGLRRWSQIIAAVADERQKPELLRRAQAVFSDREDPKARRSRFLPGQEQAGYDELFGRRKLQVSRATVSTTHVDEDLSKGGGRGAYKPLRNSFLGFLAKSLS